MIRFLSSIAVKPVFLWLSAFREATASAESTALAKFQETAAIRAFRTESKMVLVPALYTIRRRISDRQVRGGDLRLGMMLMAVAHTILCIAFQRSSNGIGAG